MDLETEEKLRFLNHPKFLTTFGWFIGDLSVIS